MPVNLFSRAFLFLYLILFLLSEDARRRLFCRRRALCLKENLLATLIMANLKDYNQDGIKCYK